MVGPVGVVLGWVAWEVVLGEVLVTWLLLLFMWQCGAFEGLRLHSKWTSFLVLHAFGVHILTFYLKKKYQ